MIAGRYTLEREIGRGGMGAVWLGRDEVLGRAVALKRVGMMPGGSTPDLARAEREARLAARLNHPHVVAVFDLVTEADERWLVMEYVDGVTLARLVNDEGPLTPDEAASILLRAADALAAAHEAGIVHRDVKPSNILVTADGQVKLSDFGIARAEADASLTQTGLVTGSPAYIAPEVASGRQATAASDVWSLGATLFHALAGRPPYEVGDNVLGALYRIVHEEPPRLTSAGWLAPVLEATMTREPADRWPMARVRDFLAGRPAAPITAPAPVTAEADPTSTRVLTAPVAAELPRHADAPARKPRWGPLLAVAAVVVAVGLVAWLALAGGEDGQPTPPAAGRTRGDSSRAATGSPSTASSGPSSQPPTSTAAATPGVTAAGMQSFVENYLATVTSDPQAAWAELTPGFQAASGGFGQYKGFWSTVESADLVSFQADPEQRRVSYTVEYLLRDGSRSTDQVTLGLQGKDGRYLIASEA